MVTVLSGLLPTGAVWATKLLIDGLATGLAERALGPVAGLVALGLASGVLPHVTGYLRGESDRWST